MNLLFIDTETTGLDSNLHEIIQIAGIIEINNEIKEEFSFNCKPFHMDRVDPHALKTNHIRFEDLSTFEDPKMVIKQIDKMLKAHSPNHNSVWTIVGQNPEFDYNFFKKLWDDTALACAKTFRNTFSSNTVDLINIATFFKVAGLYDFKDFKLITLIETLGLKFEGIAHTASADIKMTYKIWKLFSKHLEYLTFIKSKS